MQKRWGTLIHYWTADIQWLFFVFTEMENRRIPCTETSSSTVVWWHAYVPTWGDPQTHTPLKYINYPTQALVDEMFLSPQSAMDPAAGTVPVPEQRRAAVLGVRRSLPDAQRRRTRAAPWKAPLLHAASLKPNHDARWGRGWNNAYHGEQAGLF